MSPHAATLTKRHAPLLRAFIGYDALSRAELVDLASIGRSTTSELLEDLLTAGWVCPAGKRPARGLGRPTDLFRLHVPGALVLSVTFVGGRMQVMLLGLRGEQFGHRTATISTTSHFNEFFAALHNAAQELIADLHDPSAGLLACVVVVPAAVDDAQHAASMHVHASWRQVALSERISAGLGVPVVVENDANVLSLGATADLETTIAVIVGTGVGIGTVVAGHLVRGRGGLAGEVGHIRLRSMSEDELDADSAPTTTAVARTITARPDSISDHAAAAGRMIGSALTTTIAILDVDQVVVHCAAEAVVEPLITSLDAEIQRVASNSPRHDPVTVRCARPNETQHGALRVVHHHLLLLTPRTAL